MAVASYFEKQINGKEITNEFKNGIYKNVRIKEVTWQSTSQNAIGLQGGIESNAHPVSSCYHVNIYVIEFSGWPIFLVFKTPCLPEVVVVANPNPSSGGSSSGGSFFSGIMTPPSFTPPSLGGGGTGGGSGSGYTPPPYSSYTPPPNWFDWNFLFQNPNYWSVADPSMLPIGTIYTPELLHLITTLGLNQAQTEWLNSNYNLQIELREWLEETEFNEYTTLGARIALELQRLGIDEGPFDEGYQNAIINNIFPNQLPSVAGLTLTIKYRKLLAANAALLKEENPTWSNWKVLWEASAESIHLLLQFGGLVPVVGEIFDFADAGLYAIQGDGKNATLSLLSGIPVAGTYFRGASMAKKALNLANGSKAVLKWYVVGNKIVFSGRGQLRKVLGLAKGDTMLRT